MLWIPAAADRFTPGREVTVDQLVFHTTTVSWSQTIATFTTGTRLASAHYVVDELVDRVARMVRETDRAWHAGNWPVNQRSIGIEGVDNGHYDGPRDPSLYLREASLVAAIAKRRPQIPLVLETDPERPGCLRHWSTVATHCPGTLDVELIIGMARGEVGVFDPRNNAADLDWFDKRVRELVMGEEIAVYAVAVALGRLTHILPNTLAKELRDRQRALKQKPKAKRPKHTITPAQVRAGHGRG